MSHTRASSRTILGTFLILTIGLFCFAVILVFAYLLMNNGIGGEQEEINITNEEFIRSTQEFEQSKFCRAYECDYLGNYGSIFAYEISKYPKYNEFYIELTVKNDIITNYSIMLDPKRLEPEEYQLIELFLSSYSQDTDLDPTIMEFIQQNHDHQVHQICESSSIEYGSKRLWAGSVGSPILLVAEECSR